MPFWTEHLGSVAGVRGVHDMVGLPTIDKAVLRTVPEHDRLYGPPPPGTRTLETSGTSGEPLHVLYSPRAAWFQGVLRLRSSRHHGLSPWDRTAAAAFSTDDRKTPGLLGSVRRARRVVLPLDVDADELARRVLETRPAAIGGHPHMVIELGETLDGRFSPRVVTTHGETLTTERRSAIRRLFGVDPIDSYGTAECGSVAWQCRAADLYHVNHEAVVVEIVDGRGQRCRP